MKTETRTLADVDVGHGGHPGSSASELCCTITLVRPGRYEAKCSHDVGCNQGYYQSNYHHGPWRGRGDTIADAVASMLAIVPEDYADDMRRAAQEAAIQAEDTAAEATE